MLSPDPHPSVIRMNAEIERRYASDLIAGWLLRLVACGDFNSPGYGVSRCGRAKSGLSMRISVPERICPTAVSASCPIRVEMQLIGWL